MTNLHTTIEALLAEQYIVKVGEQFVFTKKFYADLAIPAITSKLEIATIVKAHQPTYVRLGIDPSLDQVQYRKAVWSKFVQDAEIPHRVDTGSGSYTIKQYSKYAAARLIQIIGNPAIDYAILVESTKHYYKTVTYKVTLMRYIMEDFWEVEYEEYQKRKAAGIITRTAGENRWEGT